MSRIRRALGSNWWLAAGAALLALTQTVWADPAGTDALLAQGAALAAIGNCAGCHTRNQGQPFAGGVALHTPFGIIYGSNITPDPDTGIGTWSRADFVRAMREGIANNGSHLYPAFPYDHFVRASDTDLGALYQFIMSRQPIRAKPPPNQLDFPADQRALMVLWNALYLDSGAAQGQVSTATVARGAYLAQSLGHCDSCHSPRNALGAEIKERIFEGGTVDGWYAPALNQRSPSPTAWDAATLALYLRTGIAPDHAMAAGPMRDVVMSLARARPEDVDAIAGFIVSMMNSNPSTNAAARADNAERARTPLASITDASNPMLARGALIYRSSCASCHDRGRGASSNSALQMPLAIALYDPDPHSLLHVVREGIEPIDGAAMRFMPAFDASLSDRDLAALLAYLRKDGAHAAPWPELDQAVKETRE